MQNEENLSVLEANHGQVSEEKLQDVDGAVKEEPRRFFEQLPSHYELCKIYADSPQLILQECLNTQTFPRPSWSEKEIEAYLENPWLPIPWLPGTVRKIPFGYVRDEEQAKGLGLDPDSILFPVPDELFALQEAKKLVKEYSYQSVTDWLIKKTGRHLTQQTLRNRIKSEKERQARATFYRRLAVRISKALIAAQKIEEQYAGAKVPWARQWDIFGENRFQFGSPEWATSMYELFKAADPRPFIKTVKERTSKKYGVEPDTNPTKIPLLDYEFGGGRIRGDFSPEYVEFTEPKPKKRKARVRAERGATD